MPPHRRGPCVRHAAAAALAVTTLMTGCEAAAGTRTTAAGVPSSVPGRPSGRSTRPATSLSARVARWRLPGPVTRARAVVTGGRVLVLGGLAPGDRSSSGVLAVDVTAGRVEAAGELAVGVHDTAAAAVDGMVMLFGGGNSREVASVQTFSATGSKVVGMLPRPRSDLETASADGHAFLFGGYDGMTTQADVLATTDGRSFTRVGHLARPVRYGAAVTVGAPGAQRILLFGGQRGGTATDAVQRFDPSTGAVTLVGRLPRPLSDAAAVVLGRAIWVVGGRSGGQATAQVLRYDEATGRAVTAGRLPYPVADAAATVTGGAGYLFGGENAGAGYLDTVTVLTPIPPH